MANTTYIPEVTVITSNTMQDLNDLFYVMLGGPANAQAITNVLPYDNSVSGLAATTIQAAITEVSQRLAVNGPKATAQYYGVFFQGTADNAPSTPGLTQDALLRMANASGLVVGDLGYALGTSEFILRSYQAGGLLSIQTTAADNSLRNSISIDPAGDIVFLHGGKNAVGATLDTTGLSIRGNSNNDPTAQGSTQDAKLQLKNKSGAVVSTLGYEGSAAFLLRSLQKQGAVEIAGTDSTGAKASVLLANLTDANSTTTLYRALFL